MAAGESVAAAMGAPVVAHKKLDRIGIQLYGSQAGGGRPCRNTRRDRQGRLQRGRARGLLQSFSRRLPRPAAAEWPQVALRAHRDRADRARSGQDLRGRPHRRPRLDHRSTPHFRAARTETVGDWKQVAAQFTAAARAAGRPGFTFAFHNHNDIVQDDERRAADRHPDAGDRSVARLVPDGHLLGRERRRRSACAPREISGGASECST